MAAARTSSWSWFPSVLERAAPSGSFVDDPFDPSDSFVLSVGEPVASLLDELDLAVPLDGTFEPSPARPLAELDDPFAWRPAHSPRAAVEQVFAEAVAASEFRPVDNTADLAEWSLADVDPPASTNSTDSIDQLADQLTDDPAELDLDELDLDELDLDELDLGDDLEAAGDDSGADWFDP